MKKLVHFLAIPAALFIGYWIGATSQSAEVAFWYNTAYQISRASEKLNADAVNGLNVCLDVVAGKSTEEEGTIKMLEIGKSIEVHRDEYDEIVKKIENR